MSETSMSEPVGADASPKRRQVLLAAEELFLVLGYGAVSMDQVARKASVSKATLYAHFPSKDVLFAVIVADKGTDNVLGDDLFPRDVTDLRAALEAIGLRMLRFMLRDRTLAIYRIALAESARFPELGHAFHQNGPQRFCDRFCAWLAELRQFGLVDTPDPVVAANQFMALMRSGVFLRRSLSLPPEASEAEIMATVSAAATTWLRAYAIQV
jgi:TetR/AcrR family transcriptional repressor of mexJK operon